MTQRRKHYSGEEKVSILRRHLLEGVPVSDVCDAAGLAPPLFSGQLPPNLLVFGPSGAGKSVTCIHVLASLSRIAESRGVAFEYFYLDLTTPKSCFHAFNELLVSLDESARRYRRGVALEAIQVQIVAALSRRSGYVCLLVDEADNIVNDVDIFLTFLANTLPRKVPTRLFYFFLDESGRVGKVLGPENSFSVEEGGCVA